MIGSGRETLPVFWEWWEAFWDVQEASRMSGSGQEALPEVWEALPDVREWSGDPPGCPSGLGSPSGCVGSPHGCPRVIEGLPECPGVVGNLSHMTGVLPNVRNWSVIPSECQGVVGRPSRMSRSSRVALTDVQE